MTMNGYLQLGWNKSCVDVKVDEHCTIPWPKCNCQVRVLSIVRLLCGMWPVYLGL